MAPSVILVLLKVTGSTSRGLTGTPGLLPDREEGSCRNRKEAR